MHLNAVLAQFARHRVAQAAFGIMVFHGDHGVLRSLGSGPDDLLPSGLML